jgi:hypothetical protein
VTFRPWHWYRLIIIAALLTSLVANIASPSAAEDGRILLVCPRGCGYSSINTALALSHAGDLIQVGPGIYLEHIMMRPGVTIRGEGNNVSIITGADSDTVVRAYGVAIGRDAVLEGVTIIAGKSFTGGGIDIRGGASPVIRGNLITANNAGSSESYGGGIFVSGGSPLIVANTFTKNHSAYGGGAIAIWDGSTAVVDSNYFEDNKADQYGGALNITRSSPTITGNTIISNTAFYGAGVDMYESAPEFTNNIIRQNIANALGGGVYLRNGSAPSIFANSFLSNTAYYYGGGLYMDRSTASVSGNTFQYNEADTGGGIYIDRSSATVARNIITNNIASYHGGGVHIHNSSATVDNNNIISNVATIGGGGMGVDGHSWPTIINNTLANNAVGMFGGAVYIEGAAPSFINNMIARNSSSIQAGGIYVENATPLISNNTIAYNNQGGSGEGIYLAARSCPTITNNIIIGNSFGIWSIAPLRPEDANPVITHNDVWNNRSGNIVGVPAANNISADPLFIRGRDGAFYLSQKGAGQPQNSPALDAGTETADDLGLGERTTAVQDIPDANVVDLGYHYRALFYKGYLPLLLDDLP